MGNVSSLSTAVTDLPYLRTENEMFYIKVTETRARVLPND